MGDPGRVRSFRYFAYGGRYSGGSLRYPGLTQPPLSAVTHPATRRGDTCASCHGLVNSDRTRLDRRSPMATAILVPCSFDIPYKYLTDSGTALPHTFLQSHGPKAARSSRPLSSLALRACEQRFQPGSIRFEPRNLVCGPRRIHYRHTGQLPTLRLEHGSAKR